MIERLVLSAGDVVLNEGVMHEGVVVIEGKTIAGLYHTSEFTPLESDRVIDCSERFICPGFIDLHNQGGGGYTVMNSSFSNIQGLSKVHASHGTTGLLLTPLIENAGTGVYRRPPLSLIPKLADMVGKFSEPLRLSGSYRAAAPHGYGLEVLRAHHRPKAAGAAGIVIGQEAGEGDHVVAGWAGGYHPHRIPQFSL